MKVKRVFLVAALAISASVGFTSCEEFFNWLDNPVVEGPVQSTLKIDTSTLSLAMGQTVTRQATSNVSDAHFTYSSKVPSVALVDKNGKITAVSVGTTIITVELEGTEKYTSSTCKFVVQVSATTELARKDLDVSTPLTLVASEDGTITVTFNGGITLASDIFYEINGGEKQTISKNTDGSATITVKAGDMVQLYSNNSSLSSSAPSSARAMARGTRALDAGAKYINIRPSMKTEIFGNVMSLLKGKDNLESASSIEGSNAFYGLFAGADKLVNNEERLLVLPATTLKEGCYQDMFSGCKGIEKAPELPAPTLTKDCYAGMFSGCSKLEEVKVLATDLSAAGCTDGWLADAGTEAGSTCKVIIDESAASDWAAKGTDAGIPDNFVQSKGVTGVSLDKDRLSLYIEDTATLTATITPADADNKEVEWTSDNPKVATVSNGKVTAVAAGKAKINVTTLDGALTAACEVVVEEKPQSTILVQSIWVLPELTLPTTSSTGLSVDILPENADNKAVIWTSDNPDIVSVNDKGDIQTHNVYGIANITAKTTDGSNLSATCKVTVKIQASIWYDRDLVEKTPTSPAFINPLGMTGDGTVTYSSSDESVAKVNSQTGEVTIAEGATPGQTAVITAQATASASSHYIYYLDFQKKATYTLRLIAPTGQGGREDYTPATW